MVKENNKSNYAEIVRLELQKIEELLSEEPNSKWAMLTTVFLMLEVDGKAEFISKRLNRLQELDPLRVNYYKSFEQKCNVEGK
jgi:hypothetical protein